MIVSKETYYVQYLPICAQSIKKTAMMRQTVIRWLAIIDAEFCWLGNTGFSPRWTCYKDSWGKINCLFQNMQLLNSTRLWLYAHWNDIILCFSYLISLWLPFDLIIIKSFVKPGGGIVERGRGKLGTKVPFLSKEQKYSFKQAKNKMKINEKTF